MTRVDIGDVDDHDDGHSADEDDNDDDGDENLDDDEVVMMLNNSPYFPNQLCFGVHSHSPCSTALFLSTPSLWMRSSRFKKLV